MSELIPFPGSAAMQAAEPESDLTAPADPLSETIAAIATGLTIAAIGIVRISGPDTLAVLDRVFTPMSGTPMSQRPDRTLVLGRLAGPDGAILDQCLATVSRGPHSYTGEDTAELQCHGSPTVLRCALDSLFAAGARQARAGEFTRRAFLNGRMDLTQAEAVVDLIEAETPRLAANAASQLDGTLYRRITAAYDTLSALCSHYHALLDFPEEDVEPLNTAEALAVLQPLNRELDRMWRQSHFGRAIREGVTCVLLGKPNVGKSSLLNAILGYDRAIVTDIPGTTRDIIGERVVFGNTPLILQDTAGIRETDNFIEHEGVERARAAATRADLALIVMDGSSPRTQEDELAMTAALGAGHTLLIQNKCDLPVMWAEPSAIRVSARTGEGLEDLEKAIYQCIAPLSPPPAGELITNPRHADAIFRACDSTLKACNHLEQMLPLDIIVTELENATTALGELTGCTAKDDIIDGIFSRFCVGK